MSATKEETDEKVSLMPRWALITVVVLVAIGVVDVSTREARDRSSAIKALNGADVRLVGDSNNKPIVDGYEPFYGHVVVMSNRRDYEKMAGFCATRPERATAVFRKVLQNGTWQGKALACHMAFCLAQENILTREDLDVIVGLLSDPNEELRRVAQRELGDLLVVRKKEEMKGYEGIGPKPPGVSGRFAAKTMDVSLPFPAKKGEWMQMRWSCPEACQAWWKAFGAKVKWDSTIHRFALAE